MNTEIKIGFLRGIGFTASFIILWVLAIGSFYLVEKHILDVGRIEFDESTKLYAETISYKVNENKLTLLGEIKNETNVAWESIDVEAELFLKGEFVKECSERISGSVVPGGSENFEMTCNCCKEAFPEFDRVNLSVKSGWSD